MEIVVVSSSKEMKKYFASIERSRKYAISFVLPNNLQKIIRREPDERLLYIDIAGFSETDFKKKLTALEKKSQFRFGIIDEKNRTNDIADFFHRGAVDYLDGRILKSGIETKRITKVLEYRPFTHGSTSDSGLRVKRKNLKIAEKGWDEIKNGTEYTFWLLYIELDMIDEWKTKSGKAHIDDVQNIFHRYIESHLNPVGGRTWMWMNQGGVFLFPFREGSREPVLTCVRIILNRTLASIEEFGYNSTITYKMALHVGNTVYRDRGHTGHIVSDTVNFLFHLGQNHTREKQFYLTSSAYQYVPEGFKQLFCRMGDFEGEIIYSMKLPKD